METLIQQAAREASRVRADLQGKLGPFEGLVVSVQGSSDTMGVAFGPTRERPMPIQHPFNGATSWIRSMPEQGTKFLMQNRFDTGQPEALKTIPQSAGQQSLDYSNGLNLYRNLDSGEHDIASAGAALAFFGKRGHLDLRSGGNIKSQLSRESQSITQGAPTFVRELLYHNVGEMGDEERIGIVKRWTTAIDEFYPQKDGKFVAEHYVQVANPAGSAPAVLFQSIEGNVYDDDGEEQVHFTSSVALRSQKFWYTTTDDFVRQEIDQNGNWLLAFPSTATQGYELLIPQGTYKSDIGLDWDVTVGRDYSLAVTGNLQTTIQQNAQWDVTNLYGLTAQEVLLEGSGAKLHLLDGQVALGTDQVEVVDILLQTLQALSVEAAAGFEAPINGVATYLALYNQLLPLKGSF